MTNAALSWGKIKNTYMTVLNKTTKTRSLDEIDARYYKIVLVKYIFSLFETFCFCC